MIWSARSTHHAVVEESHTVSVDTPYDIQTCQSACITHYCSPCINSLFRSTDMYVRIRMCGLCSLIADFGGIGSSGISFSRFSAPLALGLDEMLQICRCALSGDELVFKRDLNDEMRCCFVSR